MKGYLHKTSTVRSGKDDKMDNITNRQENYLTQLVVSMLDGKRQSREKMLKDKKNQHLQKEKESLGKVEDLWTLQEKKIQGKSHKLMNKELTSVGYMIGSNVAF